MFEITLSYIEIEGVEVEVSICTNYHEAVRGSRDEFGKQIEPDESGGYEIVDIYWNHNDEWIPTFLQEMLLNNPKHRNALLERARLI